MRRALVVLALVAGCSGAMSSGPDGGAADGGAADAGNYDAGPPVNCRSAAPRTPCVTADNLRGFCEGETCANVCGALNQSCCHDPSPCDNGLECSMNNRCVTPGGSLPCAAECRLPVDRECIVTTCNGTTCVQSGRGDGARCDGGLWVCQSSYCIGE